MKQELVSLEQALLNMHTSAGTKPPKPIVAPRKWEQRESGLIWKNELFGGLRVRVRHELAENLVEGPYMRAKVKLGKLRPEQIVLEFDIQKVEGVHVLGFKGPNMAHEDQGHLPPLSVFVHWGEKNGKWYASSRKKDQDNVDVIFLREDGIFMQLQVSLSTRDGEFFWLTIQELNQGQIVRTTHEIAKEEGFWTRYRWKNKAVVVIPARPEDAFPGYNWVGTFKDTGEGLINYAMEQGYTAQLSDCVVAEWKPVHTELTPELALNDYKLGYCLWFNVIFGGGMIAVADENGEQKDVWVYFKTITDLHGLSLSEKGAFPALMPGTSVAFKLNPNPKRDRLEASEAIQL